MIGVLNSQILFKSMNREKDCVSMNAIPSSVLTKDAENTVTIQGLESSTIHGCSRQMQLHQATTYIPLSYPSNSVHCLASNSYVPHASSDWLVQIKQIQNAIFVPVSGVSGFTDTQNEKHPTYIPIHMISSQQAGPGISQSLYIPLVSDQAEGTMSRLEYAHSQRSPFVIAPIRNDEGATNFVNFAPVYRPLVTASVSEGANTSAPILATSNVTPTVFPNVRQLLQSSLSASALLTMANTSAESELKSDSVTSDTYTVQVKDLTLDHLRPYFNKPMAVVAKELGICITLMKKICRRNGLERWPHRKIRSLLNRIASFEQHYQQFPSSKSEQRRIANQIACLRQQLHSVIHNPNERKRKTSSASSSTVYESGSLQGRRSPVAKQSQPKLQKPTRLPSIATLVRARKYPSEITNLKRSVAFPQ